MEAVSVFPGLLAALTRMFEKNLDLKFKFQMITKFCIDKFDTRDWPLQ
jgi:hypothetical protein